VTLTSIDRTQITTSIESIDYRENQQIRTRCAIAFPNKFSKLELIVQKLTELSVDEIILFGAERSQPITLQEKKRQRIATIIKEATEQSR
jgi:RsmE family RNA methyltransferase